MAGSENTPFEGMMPDDEYVSETIARARSGDRAAAIEAMQLLGEAATAGGLLSQDLASYLAQAAHAAAADPTPEGLARAFNMQRKRGERDLQRAADRRLHIALWIHLAVLRGLSLTDAKNAAGEVWGVENVDREIRDFKVTASDEGPVSWGVSDAPPSLGRWDRLFAALGKPLPVRP